MHAMAFHHCICESRDVQLKAYKNTLAGIQRVPWMLSVPRLNHL